MRVVIVESLLFMMVGLERGPLYMINQLLSILSGVDFNLHVMIVHMYMYMYM